MKKKHTYIIALLLGIIAGMAHNAIKTTKRMAEWAELIELQQEVIRNQRTLIRYYNPDFMNESKPNEDGK